MSDILHEFLDLGMIDTGGDDELLDLFEGASNSLAATLREDKSKVAQYTLIALDVNISEEHIVFKEIEEALKESWKSFRSKYKQKRKAKQILRAIVLRALQLAAEADVRVAGIIWLTAANIAEFIEYQQESRVIEQFLHEQGKLLEQHAVEKWSLHATKLKPFPSVEALELSAPQIDANTLKVLNDKLKKQATDTNSALKQAHQRLARMATVGDKRLALLWWKQTLYSPLKGIGYRELPAQVVPIFLAYDLAELVGPVAPQSVEYLLRETLVDVCGSEEVQNKITFGDFVEICRTNKTAFAELLGFAQDGEDRTTLIDFLRRELQNVIPVKKYLSHVGIDANREITLASVAVHLYRDLQAERLAEEVTNGA